MNRKEYYTRAIKSSSALKNQELRDLVWKKTGGICFYCGEVLDKKGWQSKNAFVVEHFIPIINGGGDELSNLVPSCRRCNGIKRHRDLEGFRLSMEKSLGMFFSEKQIEYLRSIGFEIQLNRYQFYFERKNG